MFWKVTQLPLNNLGISYIEKLAKNQVSWLRPEIYQDTKEIEKSKSGTFKTNHQKEIEAIQKETVHVEDMLMTICEDVAKIEQTDEFKNLCFLSYEDIKSVVANEKHCDIVAITCPEDAKMDITEEAQLNQVLRDTRSKIKDDMIDGIQDIYDFLSKEQQVEFSSEIGQLGVYLVMDEQDKNKNKDKDSIGPNQNAYDPLSSGGVEECKKCNIEDSNGNCGSIPSLFDFNNEFLI